MLPDTPAWLSYYTLILLLEHNSKVCDVQGKLNQTHLCMNECSYMEFPKRVYYVQELLEMK